MVPRKFKEEERNALIYSNHSICQLLSCYDHLYCCQLCSFVSLFSYLCFANKTFPSQLCFYQRYIFNELIIFLDQKQKKSKLLAAQMSRTLNKFQKKVIPNLIHVHPTEFHLRLYLLCTMYVLYKIQINFCHQPCVKESMCG